MRSVDTNVLVRLMTRDDVRQVALAETFVANGAWVPQLAIAEATWVLASVYDRRPEAVATAVETRGCVLSILVIILIVIVVLALLGFFGFRGRA